MSVVAAKILQVVFGHYDVVTVVTRSECNLNNDCYIVTGSKDCTVMVWMFSAKYQAIVGDNGSECLSVMLFEVVDGLLATHLLRPADDSRHC